MTAGNDWRKKTVFSGDKPATQGISTSRWKLQKTNLCASGNKDASKLGG